MKRKRCVVALLLTACTLAVPIPSDAQAPGQDTTVHETTGTVTDEADSDSSDSSDSPEASPLGSAYDLWGWNVPIYYYYLYKHLFAGYPWVVRIAYSVVLLCCLSFLILVLTMSVDIYLRRRNRKKYEQLRDQYEQKLIDVCLAKVENLPTDEIKRRIDYKEKKWKHWELRQWAYVFINVSTHTNTLNPNLTNIQRAMHMVGFNDYMEKRLVQGRHSQRVRVIQCVRLTNMELPTSAMAHLLNHKDLRLRRAARLYYIATSKADPMRTFEVNEKGKGVMTTWDKMELHEVFYKVTDAGNSLPSFIPFMQKMENPELVKFFINETAYWGTDADMEFLFQYFNSPSFEYREAAFQSMGLRKFRKGEEGMKKVYHKQTEHLRRCILHALLDIQSGKSLPFFIDSYETATSDFTRRAALRCIWMSGTKGHIAFNRLKAKAPEDQQLFFEHVESPIINNDAP